MTTGSSLEDVKKQHNMNQTEEIQDQETKHINKTVQMEENLQ